MYITYKPTGTGKKDEPLRKKWFVFSQPPSTKNSDKKDLGELYRGLFLVRPGGFEPLAFRVGAERSIQLSYDRI